MANITTALGATAGIVGDAHGAEILLDLPNNSVFMGQGAGPSLIKSYTIEPGDNLSAPVIGGRTARAVTRGGSETTAVTFDSISDSEASFTKRFAYNAFEVGYPTANDMTPARLGQLTGGLREQATMALANDVDTQVLSLYSSAANSVGSSGVDFTIGNLAEAKKLLKVANVPVNEPIYCVLPSTQEDHLAQTDELTRYDIRGEGNTMVNGSMYRWQGINIFTTGNVPTAAGAAHGLVFSRAGILMAIRDFPLVRIWEEPEDLAAIRYLAAVDWAYANSFSDWIVDFQTTDS